MIRRPIVVDVALALSLCEKLACVVLWDAKGSSSRGCETAMATSANFRVLYMRADTTTRCRGRFF